MPLTPPQRTIFDDPARFRVVSAGRRFGKTYLSMYEIARVARFPGKKIYYVAPTRGQAKNIIWQDLKDQMFGKGWARKANESELTMELINGSVIGLRTADNFDSMRGVSLDFAVLDECAFMSQETWTQVLRPTLSDRKGGALFISTPQGMGNWFYDLWQFGHTNDNWASFQYTTIQGGNVDPLEVEAARNDLDAKTFEAEYEAKFTSTSNNIYYAFGPENLQRYEQPVPNRILVGMDFNINPMSAAIFAPMKNGLHQFDEIVLPNSNTDEMCQELRSRYPNAVIDVYPDPAGSARKTSSIGKTDHVILREYGFRVFSPKAHPPVKDRINSVNRLLCDAAGNRNYFIDPGCKQTITSLSKHSYKPGTNIPDKGVYDHMTDSLGYAISYLYPLKTRHDTSNRPKSFGAF